MGSGRGSQTDGAGAKPVVASGLICRRMHPALSPVPHRRSVFVLALEVASIYLSSLLLLLRSPKCFFLIVRTILDDLNIN